MSNKTNVVVIGSGISGLVCSTILAMKGFRVTLLEKNHQLGGALQVFSRDKVILDTAVHYVGSLDRGEILQKLFSYLNVYEQLELKRMDESAFDVFRFSDSLQIKHGMGYERFKQNLATQFVGHESEIEAICDEIIRYCTYFPLYNLALDAPINYVRNPEVLEVGAWSKLQSLTNNEQLIRAFLGSGPLYCGKKNQTPFYVLALILNSYIKGSYRFTNGASQLAKVLAKQLRKNGGVIHKKKEVSAVKINDERKITHVLCKDGSEYAADFVVSSLHPNQTISIVGEKHFSPAFRNRMQSVENTTASFMLYVLLEKGAVPYINSNFYDYFTDQIWDTEYRNDAEWPSMLFTSFQHSKRTPEFSDSISVMCYLDIEAFDRWKETQRTIVDDSTRTADYYSFKQHCEQKVLKRVIERFPELDGRIKSIHSSSPLTYRDFLATPNGSMYGIQKDFNKIHHTQINTRTHLPNLYLTGQNVLFHGILGASLAGLLTSFHFLDKEQLINEING